MEETFVVQSKTFQCSGNGGFHGWILCGNFTSYLISPQIKVPFCKYFIHFQLATIELQINEEDANPALLTAYAITTALLVGTSMIAFSIGTCILPYLEAATHAFGISGSDLAPHDKLMRLVDISWILTNSASLFLFTLDFILMCWIKYTLFHNWAPVAATLIIGPALILIVCSAFIFYRKIMTHQYAVSNIKLEELDRLHKRLEKVESLSSLTNQYFSPPRAQPYHYKYNHHDSPPHFIVSSSEASPQAGRSTSHSFREYTV